MRDLITKNHIIFEKLKFNAARISEFASKHTVFNLDDLDKLIECKCEICNPDSFSFFELLWKLRSFVSKVTGLNENKDIYEGGEKEEIT